MINVWIKYGEPCLYGIGETELIIKLDVNLTNSENHENDFKVGWHMSAWSVHTMINVWTKYGEPRLYGNGETGLITKTLTLLKAGKAISMSRLQWLSSQTRQQLIGMQSNLY